MKTPIAAVFSKKQSGTAAIRIAVVTAGKSDREGYRLRLAVSVAPAVVFVK
jgi:hypothetical protein